MITTAFVDRKALLRALIDLKPCIAKKTTLPELTQVCLQYIDFAQELQVLGTNLTVSMAISVRCDQVLGGMVGVLVDYSQLKTLIRCLQSEIVEITANTDTWKLSLDLSGGAVEIPCFSADRYEFRGFLARAEIESSAWRPARKLLEGFDLVRRYATWDEARPALMAVDYETVIAATDGFRVGYLDKNESQFTGLIPIEATPVLRKLDRTTMKFAEYQDLLCLQNNGTWVSVAKGDGKFPDAMAIIPKDFLLQITLEPERLRTGLRVAQQIYHAGNGAVRIEIKKESIVLTADSLDVGSIFQEIVCEVAAFGKAQNISFPYKFACNGDFLAEYLDQAGHYAVTLSFNRANAPILLRCEQMPVQYLLMPMHMGSD